MNLRQVNLVYLNRTIQLNIGYNTPDTFDVLLKQSPETQTPWQPQF